MRLLLVQHGEAVPESEDPDRPLSARGRAEIEAVAAFRLEYADWGCILDLGRNHFDGPADTILSDPRIQELYLGVRKGKTA